MSKEDIDLYDYLKDGYYLLPILKDYGICLPAASDLEVFGKGSDQEFAVLSFKVKPCTLSTGCATKEEMGRVNFQWIMPASTFDSANYTHPRAVLANADDIYYINPGLRQIYAAKFKENIVWDSKGLFDPDLKQRTRYFDISNVFVTNAYRDVQSSGVVFNYKRSYKTLGDTLGDIGGLNGVIILVFMVLAKPFIDWSYDRHILNKVYSFLEDDAAKKIFTESSKDGEEQTLNSKELNSTLKKKVGGSFMSKISCCYRKKKDISSKLREEALDLMEANFDIVNIIRDLNTIKVLADIFLKERHLKLAQMVCFKVSHNEKSKGDHQSQTAGCCPLSCKSSPKSKPREHEYIHELKSTDNDCRMSLERVQNLKSFFQSLSDNYFKEAIFGSSKEEEILAPHQSVAEEFDETRHKHGTSHRQEPLTIMPPNPGPQEGQIHSVNGIGLLNLGSQAAEHNEHHKINTSSKHINI